MNLELIQFSEVEVRYCVNGTAYPQN